MKIEEKDLSDYMKERLEQIKSLPCEQKMGAANELILLSNWVIGKIKDEMKTNFDLNDN